MTTYLRCEYQKGMFSHEYMIRFKPTDQRQTDWMFVNKEDVIPDTDTTGVMRLKAIYSKTDGIARIGINDVGDHRISNVCAPLDELVER